MTFSCSRVPRRRGELTAWAQQLPTPWIGALEATLFTGWIYDFLLPFAAALKVAHPAMLTAIAASKKKNDRADARKIADLLRCDLLPVCYTALRELRRWRSAKPAASDGRAFCSVCRLSYCGILSESERPFSKRNADNR